MSVSQEFTATFRAEELIKVLAAIRLLYPAMGAVPLIRLDVGEHAELVATHLPVSVKAELDWGVEGEGSVTLVLDSIWEIVANLEGEVALRAFGLEICLRTASCSYTLQGLDPAQFCDTSSPAFAATPAAAGNSVSLTAARFAGAMRAVLPFVSRDEKHPGLNGVRVHRLSEGRISFASTDGFRMAVWSMRVPPTLTGAYGVTLPIRALRVAAGACGLVAEICGDHPPQIELDLCESGKSTICVGQFLITIICEPSPYPEYWHVVGSGEKLARRGEVPRLPLLKALKRLKAVAPGGVADLRLDPGSSQLVCRGKRPLGCGEERIFASLSGGESGASLLLGYLIEALEAMASAYVEILMDKEWDKHVLLSPCTDRAEGRYYHVLSPEPPSGDCN